MQHVRHALDGARRLAIRTRNLGAKLLGVLLQKGIQRPLSERLTDLKREVFQRRDVRIGFEGLGLTRSPSDNFSPRLCQIE
jgi:hypothetical protein